MKKRFFTILLAIVITVGTYTSVFALPNYLSQFNTRYGTAGTTIDSCGLCHINANNPGGRNAYGSAFGSNGHNFAAIETLDSDGDTFANLAEIEARTFPGDPSSQPVAVDTTPPTVTGFAIPASFSSLTVAITTFTATDAVGVTGFIVTETNAAPAAEAPGWSASAPANHTFATEGAKTLYAWAKDAAANVSSSVSASVSITLPDTTAPTVTGFAIPATSDSLTVAINTLTATDNVAVTGYMVSESATEPGAADPDWLAAPPANYTFTTEGANTLFAWAKDAAGNVSASASASVTITLPSPPPPPPADTEPPTVTAFSVPEASNTLDVSINTFAASDNIAVTGYMVTESAIAPGAADAGWVAAPLAGYTFSSEGAKTLYAWAKDAAGNVSASASASVTITLPSPPPPPPADTEPPIVAAFSIPATSSSLEVPIDIFTANDNVAVTGFMVTETSTAPEASDHAWTSSPPASYTFSADGAQTIYAWAKDAAGNVSLSANASVTITLPDSPAPDLSIWVGKWFKIMKRSRGYTVNASGWQRDVDVAAGYLKIWAWDTDTRLLQGDLYLRNVQVNEHTDDDNDKDEAPLLAQNSVQWQVEPFNLNYIAGSNDDFLVSFQTSGDLTTGFTARIKGWEKHGTLEQGRIQSLGGYYLEANNQPGLNESSSGSISLMGYLYPESRIPVSTDVIIVH